VTARIWPVPSEAATPNDDPNTMRARKPEPRAGWSDLPTPLRTLDRAVLYATVALTGGAVMVLELLGTRIVGPFYGVSLYVWSSLIAVTMIALALGYFVGGWCADRLPRLRLAHLLVLAALGTLLVPLLGGVVLPASEPLGMRAGAFFSTLALFLLPLTALGMASPYVIKLAASDLGAVGTTAGSVYAVSTVGSVLATLAVGFYLLPEFGTRSIIEGTGLALLALAAALAFRERRRFTRLHLWALAGTVLLIALLGAIAAFAPVRVAEGFTVRHEAESTYGWVRVVDDERRGIRLLLSDASSIGAVRIANGRSVLGYQQLLMVLPMIRAAQTPEHPRNALLIGLGAGYVARQLRAAGIETDTIEIDPAVAQAARDYFDFQPTGAFLIGDGRYVVRNLRKHYDFIIHDCFTGGAEPIHMLTREMFAQLRELLADDGVLAVNFVGFQRGEGSEAVASLSRTLAGLFPVQRVFVTLPQSDFTDFVFLVAKQPFEFAGRDQAERNFLSVVSRHETSVPAGAGVELTDDFNPLERMQIRKAERYRELFVERIAPALLVR